MRTAVSWSGGKDSALAMARALEAGHDVGWLLNFVDPVSGRDRAHGLRDALLRAQGDAVGLPMVQRDASWESYELEFKRAVRALKAEGLEGVVFGDISLRHHREWGERVCKELGVAALYPLWGMDHAAEVREFRARGFRAVVVAVNPPLGKEWLGRWLDDSFLQDMTRVREDNGVSPAGEAGARRSAERSQGEPSPRRSDTRTPRSGGGVSPAGEGGEYHTLVVGGPLFKRPLDVQLGETFALGSGVGVDVTLGKRD